jgi:hypothetical protein
MKSLPGVLCDKRLYKIKEKHLLISNQSNHDIYNAETGFDPDYLDNCHTEVIIIINERINTRNICTKNEVFTYNVF